MTRLVQWLLCRTITFDREIQIQSLVQLFKNISVACEPEALSARCRRNLINGVFTLKTLQMFSVHTTLEKFCHFEPVFEENSAGKSHDHDVIIFEMFSVHTKTQSRFQERFRKAPFSWRISVGGKPNRRNKTAFSNFSGSVWMGPEIHGVLQKMHQYCTSDYSIFTFVRISSLSTTNKCWHTQVHVQME